MVPGLRPSSLHTQKWHQTWGIANPVFYFIGGLFPNHLDSAFHFIVDWWYLHTYIRIYNFIHTTVFTSRSFSPPPLFFLPSLSQLLHAHTHTHTHTHTHLTHTTCHHTQLTLPHTTYSTPILHHLFSFSCFPHAIFTFLLLLVGRSWHVGLSGPLISTSLGFQRRGAIFSVTRQYPAGSIQGSKAAMCWWPRSYQWVSKTASVWRRTYTALWLLVGPAKPRGIFGGIKSSGFPGCSPQSVPWQFWCHGKSR